MVSTKTLLLSTVTAVKATPPPNGKIPTRIRPEYLDAIFGGGRLRQMMQVPRKLALQELFCASGGCRDLGLFHAELRKIYVTPETIIREIPPGLLQHVLTVLVFWSWFLLLPRLPPWSRSLRLFPWASILL